MCCLDLIKYGSSPFCFLLHSCTWPWALHQALCTPLHLLQPASQPLRHLCTSYLLDTCVLCHRRHSPCCSMPSTLLLSQGPPASQPLHHPYSFQLCLISPSGPGKSTACSRWQTPLSPGFVTSSPVPCCSWLPVFTSFPSCCPSSFASQSTAAGPHGLIIGYHLAGDQLPFCSWEPNFFVTRSNF